jgi:hypothetical protein
VVYVIVDIEVEGDFAGTVESAVFFVGLEWTMGWCEDGV